MKMEINKAKNALNPFLKKSFWIWLSVLAVIPLSVLVVILVVLTNASKSLPALENLERIEPPLISKVYDQDSVLIHEFYTERRIWTDFKDIPEKMVQAVVAIEDRKFYDHWGVNIQAYPSALLPALVGKRARGASTLTQQLAKNLFLTPQRSVFRKIKELLLAIQIEQTYTKQEILEYYLNEVYLGGGAYGFQAGAQKYFSMPLDSLSIAQMALLAGLLPRPETYRPDRNLNNARNRRNLVLKAMYEEDFIDQTELIDNLKEKIDLDVWQQSSLKAPYFVETIRQKLEKKWNEDFIYGKGVNIYSTLDYDIQKSAEESLLKNLQSIKNRIKHRTAHFLSMPYHLKTPIDTIVKYWDSTYAYFDSVYINGEEEKKRRKHGRRQMWPDSNRYVEAQAAVVVIENKTGAIKAMVGGENFVTSKFNRAMQANRSPGSTFKAIVYSAAIDSGAAPMDSINDQPITIPDPDDPTKTWRPKNYDNSFSGNISLREAFYKSKNLPAIKVGLKTGIYNVYRAARRFGLTGNIPRVHSIGIGVGEVNLLEMTSAYSAFPNLGMRHSTYFIQSITDKNHRPIYNHIPSQKRATSSETAYIMTTLMTDVNKRGTAARIWASGFHYPSGGKTGTTNDETDAWYIGFTKHYTTGVWVGIDNHKPMGRGHTGTRNAAPIWIDIMKNAHKNFKIAKFYKPSKVQFYSICQVTRKISGPFCSHVSEDFFIEGRQPKAECDGTHRNKKGWKQTGDAFSSGKKRMKTFKVPQKKKKKKEKNKEGDIKRVRKTF